MIIHPLNKMLMKNIIELEYLVEGREVFWDYGDEKFSGTIIGFSKHRLTGDTFIRVSIIDPEGDKALAYVPVEDIMSRLAVYN